MVEGVVVYSNVIIVVVIIGIVGSGGFEFKFEGCVCFGIILKIEIIIEMVEFGVIG